MGIAEGEKGLSLVLGQLIGSKVFAPLLHKHKGTVVGYVVAAEKVLGSFEAFLHEGPEPPAAHFTAVTVKSINWFFWMAAGRGLYRRFNAHPIPNKTDFPKGNSCLGHAPGAWIHSDKKNIPGGAGKASYVLRMGGPCVDKRIVGKGYFSVKAKGVACSGELGCCRFDCGCDGVHNSSVSRRTPLLQARHSMPGLPSLFQQAATLTHISQENRIEVDRSG